MLTKERACEAWEARGLQNSVEHTLTQAERDYVKLIWDHMSGNTAWMDAFHLIRNSTRAPRERLQPLDFVIVKDTHGLPEFHGRRGMIRNAVQFGKFYVYLRPAGQTYNAEIALWLVDESDLEKHVPSNVDTVKLTGVTRDRCGWGTPNEVKPGDAVDDSVYWEMLEVVPPVSNKADLMQMGETMDHNGAGDKPRYLTLQKYTHATPQTTSEEWIYTGVRVRGERVKLET